MKKLLIVMLFISSMIWSQELKVFSSTELTDVAGNNFYFPTLNYDGTKILLTKDNYKGLWLFDVFTKVLTVISEDPGAGYRPVFSEDDTKIMYKVDIFEGIKKYSSLVKFDLTTNEKTVLINKERFMNFYKSPETNSLIVKTATVTQNFNIKEFRSIEQSSIPNFAMMENDIVKIYKNNNVLEYQPFGPGNYIWVSSSTDNKLLFTFAGKGTFVNDFNTNTIYELGYANAPIFNNDGKYVIYMNDKDDGEVIISSDILVSTFDGTKTYNLTNTTNRIEVYPNISGNGKKIAYCTDDAHIFIIELSFE
ncbi:MAG: hypothetical protein V1773_16200 [bacterium]